MDRIILKISDIMPQTPGKENEVTKNETEVSVNMRGISSVRKVIEFYRPFTLTGKGNVDLRVPFSLSEREIDAFIDILATMMHDPTCAFKDFTDINMRKKLRSYDFSNITGEYQRSDDYNKTEKFRLTVYKNSPYFKSLSKFYMPHCMRYLELENLKMPLISLKD